MPTIEPRILEAAEDGLEDRDADLVVGRQADADELAAAGERAERLLERDRADGGRDRGVGAAEALDRGDRVLLARVDEVLGAERSAALASRASLMSTATTAAPVMRAYWTARWPSPPAPNTATRLEERRAGDLDRLVGGHAGAGQRRGVERVDAVRHAHDVAGVADRVLGEPAVEGVADVHLLRAERLAAGVAVPAVAARVPQPRQRDADRPAEAVHVPAPSCSTMPTPSWPGMNGGDGLIGHSPRAAWMSV